MSSDPKDIQVINAPGQVALDTARRLSWEEEETLVDKRNKPLNRVLRFIRTRRWLILFLVIAIAALFNAGVMRAVIGVGQAIGDFFTSATQPPALGQSGFLQFLTTLLQIVIIIMAFLFQFIIFFWLGSRTRMYTIWPGAEGVSFKDYRGQPELLEQAQQIVTLLRGVKAFEDSGGEPLNGLLLEGPPGTGKTWLAQAISTEAGVPFFFVDASSMQGTFIGMGAIKVMRLYGKARRAAREFGAAVVFMDEIDSIGSRGAISSVRGQEGGIGGMGGMSGGMGSMGLLSTMLIEMSGFSLEHGWRAKLRTAFYRTILRRNPPPIPKRVLTIGATNRISALDQALLRPGRFDKKLRVDAPDMEGRRDIIAYYLSKMAHDDTMRPEVLAADTPGYTPADIKYLLNEALRYALFDGRKYMTYRDFQLAQPEHEMGLRSPAKHLSQEAKRRIAYHEAGHAVAVRLFQPHHRISRITIIRQGGAFGHVTHFPATESYQGMRQKSEWINRLRVTVAGKAAEVEFCGIENQTLGVGGDFAAIRAVLSNMALAGMLGPLGGALGMRASIGGMVLEPTEEMVEAMETVFQEALTDTRAALAENRHIVDALVARLLEQEELLADDVKAFFDQFGLHTPDPASVQEEVFEFPTLPPAGAQPAPQAGD